MFNVSILSSWSLVRLNRQKTFGIGLFVQTHICCSPFCFFLSFRHLSASLSTINLEKEIRLAPALRNLTYCQTSPDQEWLARVPHMLSWDGSLAIEVGEGRHIWGTTTNVFAELNSYAYVFLWMLQWNDVLWSLKCCGCLSRNRMCLGKQGPRAGYTPLMGEHQQGVRVNGGCPLTSSRSLSFGFFRMAARR